VKLMTVKMKAALVILGGILLASALAPLIAPWDPLASDLARALEGPSGEHLLGTDNIGRDLLSRVLYGGRQSILLALAATALSMALGFVLGLFAGYFQGGADMVITTASNIFQGLPGMTLMIAVAGIMGQGVKSMLLAIVLNSWAGFSRIVRGEVMRLKRESFVDGLKTVGAGNFRILFLHITPNLFGTLCVMFATRVAGNVIAVASMSFLGLGLQPPAPDWGVMINDARQYFRQRPLLVLAPGLCVVLLSLSVNLAADGLRDWMDTRGENADSM
jgi:peptide/nickel transport system permease protein